MYLDWAQKSYDKNKYSGREEFARKYKQKQKIIMQDYAMKKFIFNCGNFIYIISLNYHILNPILIFLFSKDSESN